MPDDAALVDTTVELNNDLTRSVVIDELEFVDVACYWTKTSPSVRAQPAFRSHPGRDRQPMNPSSSSLSSRQRYVPCFCITCKNLITTLETGRTST